MNGYLNGLKMAWNNKAVQNTLAGVGGFIACRVYPAVKSTAAKGIKTLKVKWDKQNGSPEPSSEG
jgi:hypothetical protein